MWVSCTAEHKLSDAFNNIGQVWVMVLQACRQSSDATRGMCPEALEMLSSHYYSIERHLIIK